MSKDTYWDVYEMGVVKSYHLYLADPNEPRTFHETGYMVDRLPKWAKWAETLGRYSLRNTGMKDADGSYREIARYRVLANAKAEAERLAKEER